MLRKEKTPSACLWSSAGACSLALLFFCTLAGATSGMAQTNDLIISEIMYHPLGDGVTDGVEFEFIELKNTGASIIDLAGMAFTKGIDYTFSAGATLAAGGLVVLASNSTLFEARYGLAPFAQYTGRLDNAGERVTLSTSSGALLFSVRYNDKYPWPISPDGNGFSLVTANPNADPDHAAHWRFSNEISGSPGADVLVAIPSNHEDDRRG